MISPLRAGGLVGCLALLIAALLPAVPASASGTLGAHAAARGKYFGTGTDNSQLNDSPYRAILNTEFGQITPADAMMWDATEPTRGNFNFTSADAIATVAAQNGQALYGGALVWHSHLPAWFQSVPAADALGAMRNHITGVMDHFEGDVARWDVVKEPLNENGTRRQSILQIRMGDSYIAEAFRAARAADPSAKLYLSEYGVEGDNAKSTALFTLVQSLLQQGVPIDGVAMQGHFLLGQLPAGFQANMQRYASIGLDVAISELDIRMPLPRTAAKDAQQAGAYRDVVNACLAVTRCVGMTLSEFSDKYSLVPLTFLNHGAAAPWDQNMARKPAYTAIHDALAGPVNPTPPTPPGAPIATNVTATSATLTWTPATGGTGGIAGYILYREMGAADPVLAQPTANTVDLTGLTPSTTYQVYVRARDAAGNVSVNSPIGTFTTLAGGACTVTPTVASAWSTGYVINLTIRNISPVTIPSWTVMFTLPSGHTIVSLWNATMTITGQNVIIRGNTPIPSGGSLTIGFQASRPYASTQFPSGYTCSTP